MAGIKLVESINHVIIQIEGNLSITDAQTLKEELARTLTFKKPIHIDLSKVTEFDLTAFQLFCSAHRTALNQGIQMRILPQNSRQFLEIIDQIGYPRLMGCDESNPQDCLWILE